MAVFGVGGISGLLAGFSADPVQTTELSPAEIVALRFSADSNPVASNPVASNQVASNQVASNQIAPSPAPAGYVLASAEKEPATSGLLFSPYPTYSSPATQSVTARAPMPAALAYAGPDAEERIGPAVAAARPESMNAAPTSPKRVAQPPRPASPSNALLNNAQIASIRERLKLTSYQEQLWPPVESALREIAWHQSREDAGRKGAPKSDSRGAAIDPNSAQVQRFKSAAVPLIMSLSDDQKQEVRTMARLMGLENLASQF